MSDEESDALESRGEENSVPPGAVDPSKEDEPPQEEEQEEECVVGQGSKKPLRGKVWKSSLSGDYVRYRADGCGTDYCPGNTVYIDSQRPEQPYYVCAIQSLKMSKRDSLMVHVKWFYRTSEVPEQVYQLLVQDRHTEHGSAKYDVIHDPITRKRELFISDATDIYPVSVLRGKCTVYHCSDIISFRNFVPEKDTFFYTLSYNPETRRLASTQGEIRVGASHQAKLPVLQVISDVSQIPDPKEDPTWEPGRIHDHDLLMYLRAGRSMAAFAALCDGGSTEDGFATASRDSITANAIAQLHEVDYDTGKALQNLLKRPNPPDAAREWREEDIKDFIKGLRIYGKNFFKIKSEFLPQKETSDLINFYYLWKKSPGAANNRPRGRRHRPNIVRRIKSSKGGNHNTNNSNAAASKSEDPTDLSSASEGEEKVEEDPENGEKELSPYYCRHCYSTSSRDWHHASKEKILVCRECRMYFKKYGELPNLDPRKESQDDNSQEFAEEEGIKKEEEEEGGPKETTEEKKVKEEKKVEEPPKNEVAEEKKESFAPEPKEAMETNDEEQEEEENKPQELTTTTSSKTPVESKPPLVSSVPPPPPSPRSSSTSSGCSGGGGVGISHSISSVLPPPPSNRPLNLHQPHLPPNPRPPFSPQFYPHPLDMKDPLQKNSILSSMFNPALRPHFPPHHFQPKDPEVQILSHHRSTPTPPAPPIHREPSPPPKPDGSECHRSQSAIFIRNWNRGEGNSCSRTDMYFKPVPESKLARKRDERLRKASSSNIEERESKILLPSHGFSSHSHPPEPQQQQQPPSSTPFHPPPPPHMSRVSPHPASPLASSFKLQEMERYERERKEEFLRMSSMGPFDHRRALHHGSQVAAAAESRRFEDMARAERHYMDRINALDPLLRLQMVSPAEAASLTSQGMPPLHHPHHHPPHPGLLNPLLNPGGASGRPLEGQQGQHRFNPAELMGLRYPPPPGLGHHPELLQRQLLLERELLAAHGAAAAQHQSLLAQQEEFLRLEQEARARQGRP